MTDATASSEIAWYSAFWLLQPLAFNAMIQPSGQVLGSSISYRTYMRCSPFICAADALCLFLRTLAYSIDLKVSPRKALKVIKAERFAETLEANEPEGGIQSLEKLAWMRVIAFLLGVLPPAVKLASSNGIPCTKAWGLMFLAAYGIIEVLLLLAESEADDDVDLERRDGSNRNGIPLLDRSGQLQSQMTGNRVLPSNDDESRDRGVTEPSTLPRGIHASVVGSGESRRRQRLEAPFTSSQRF